MDIHKGSIAFCGNAQRIKPKLALVLLWNLAVFLKPCDYGF
ncbi:hypothetical protein [uncultured Helicobacter sp.]|nr:hypothetical protein [uncultured Helicobacter sp.]